jgi:hypothetical protein
MAKHFPKSKETIKGHAQKSKSGQQSTTCKPSWDGILVSKHEAEEKCTHPLTKKCEIFIRVYNVKDNKALLKIYTNQTGRFPKKSSFGNQYVMVLVGLNSSAILVKAMKNCTSG